MPAIGKATHEQRLREALLKVLRRIGVLRSDLDPPDSAIIDIVNRCQLGDNDFVICPDLDDSIPF